MSTKVSGPDGSALSEGLGAAAPKHDRADLWGNLLMAHVWGAACWVRPGWLPAAVALVWIIKAALSLYKEQNTRAIELRDERESA